MQQTHRPWLKLNLNRYLLTTWCLGVVMAGCASTPALPVTTIHEDSRSAVFLQNVSDRSYVAAHPIKLDEATLASVLRGVHTEEKTTGFVLRLGKALKFHVPQDNQVFSEEEVAHLTPYLSAALAQAAPNQRVGLRLYSSSDIPTRSRKDNVETTEAYLFVQGQSLHFTLTLYRYNPGKSEQVAREPRPAPNNDGLRDFEVKFLPDTALRPDKYGRSGWFGKSEDRTLVIDYELLDKLVALPPEPAPSAAPPAAKPVAQPVQPPPTMPGPAPKSDPELQALREELKALQKQMDEQSAELQKLKKSPQKKKSSP
jgi:hypothetical protein